MFGQPGSTRFVVLTAVVAAIVAGLVLLLIQGGLSIFSENQRILAFSIYQSPQMSGPAGFTAFSVLNVSNVSDSVATNVFVELRIPSGSIRERSISFSNGVVVENVQQGRNSYSALVRELNPGESVKLSILGDTSSVIGKPDFVVRAPNFSSKERPDSADKDLQLIAIFPLMVVTLFATTVAILLVPVIRRRTTIVQESLRDVDGDRKSFMILVLGRAGLADLALEMRHGENLSYRGIFDMIFDASLRSPSSSDRCAKALRLALMSPYVAESSRQIALLYLEKMVPNLNIGEIKQELDSLSKTSKTPADVRRKILDAT